MKTKNIIIICTIVLCVSLTFIYCGSKTKTGGDTDMTTIDTKITNGDSDLPLNISVYLDLSDRITRDLTPTQKERDMAIVGYIADYFKEHTQGPKILQSKNSMKVFFYPAPKNTKVATLAGELNVNMQKYQGVNKRIALENMRSKFNENLNLIYDMAIEANKFPGCDIWDFFSNKNNVDIQCIRKGFRNILVILTDGYLFDENHMVQDGDAYSYISSTTLKNPNSSLIVKRAGLEDLEVRILEVNPKEMSHRDHLVSILENWLKDMGVKQENITVVETNLPSTTQTVIESFLD